MSLSHSAQMFCPGGRLVCGVDGCCGFVSGAWTGLSPARAGEDGVITPLTETGSAIFANKLSYRHATARLTAQPVDHRRKRDQLDSLTHRDFTTLRLVSQIPARAQDRQPFRHFLVILSHCEIILILNNIMILCKCVRSGGFVDSCNSYLNNDACQQSWRMVNELSNFNYSLINICVLFLSIRNISFGTIQRMK